MNHHLTGVVIAIVTVSLAPTLVLAQGVEHFNSEEAFAGTSLVTTATGCEHLILVISKDTPSNGSTQTSMEYFVIDTCAGGQIRASGFGVIPNSAFALAPNHRSAELRTTTPASATGATGTIDVTWTLTDLEDISSTGMTRVLQGGQSPSEESFKSTRDQRSATVSGTVVGFKMNGSGQFGWSSSKVSTK